MSYKFRASSAAPLFTGTDGLTDAQQKEYDDFIERLKLSETDPKKKLTPNMEAKLTSLQEKIDNLKKGIVELPQGAKTYVESVVEKRIYQYDDPISTKEMLKGTMVESGVNDEGVEVFEGSMERLGKLLFRKFKKSETYLEKLCFTGHPDIEDEDEEAIRDIKSPWSKKTFPKTIEQGKNTTYEWQLKLYMYMKGWCKAYLDYVLTDTPEELIPEREDLSLHDMGDLPLEYCVTTLEYELTDDDIAHIERRGNAALKYAAEYEQVLLNKNK